MAKFDIVSDWNSATIAPQTRALLQSFADGLAKEAGLLRKGDIVRWSLKSSGSLGYAVFRPTAGTKPDTKAEAPATAGFTQEQLTALMQLANTLTAGAKAPGKASQKKSKTS